MVGPLKERRIVGQWDGDRTNAHPLEEDLWTPRFLGGEGGEGEKWGGGLSRDIVGHAGDQGREANRRQVEEDLWIYPGLG